jgi:hypothetical protein
MSDNGGPSLTWSAPMQASASFDGLRGSAARTAQTEGATALEPVYIGRLRYLPAMTHRRRHRRCVAFRHSALSRKWIGRHSPSFSA